MFAFTNFLFTHTHVFVHSCVYVMDHHQLSIMLSQRGSQNTNLIRKQFMWFRI